jgi:hypothetical protein
MGIELADAIGQEHHHRCNHRMAEPRRVEFPHFGHYDTWFIDAIQILVEINHNVLVFPTRTKNLDYVEAEESCGVTLDVEIKSSKEKSNHIPRIPLSSFGCGTFLPAPGWLESLPG